MSTSSSFYRTYSSPNLRDNNSTRYNSNSLATQREWESQKQKFGYDDFGEDDNEIFYVIGDRVHVDGFRPASVAYFGEVEFASGDWVGVVLDMPTGNHDGRIHGRQYFQCSPMHGLFVRPSRVTRMQDGAVSSSNTSSRQATPLPTRNNMRFANPTISSYRNSSLSSSSPYIYDEDYRREPNIATLEEKLKSIDNLNYYDDNYSRPSSRTAGILKKSFQPTRSHSIEPTSRISSRADELADRIQKVSQQQKANTMSVFNFRPRRSQLSEYENDYSYDDYRSIRRRTPTPSPSPATKTKTVDLSNEPARLGDHVMVRTERGKIGGILKFLGETNFATGQWAGVQLYKAEGKNDGSVLGYRYFFCPQNYGLFVPISRITKQQASDFNSINIRSTLKSPPPLTRATSGGSSYNSPSLYDDHNRTPSSASSSGYNSSYSIGNLNNINTKQAYPYSSSRASNTTSSLSSSPIVPNMTTSSRLFSDTPLPKTISRTYNNSPAKLSWNDLLGNDEYSSRKSKFDDRDIEYQLQRSLSKSSLDWSKPLSTSLRTIEKPKSVQYTFTSSKYDGNPVARRTIVYN